MSAATCNFKKISLKNVPRVFPHCISRSEKVKWPQQSHFTVFGLQGDLSVRINRAKGVIWECVEYLIQSRNHMYSPCRVFSSVLTVKHTHCEAVFQDPPDRTGGNVLSAL